MTISNNLPQNLLTAANKPGADLNKATERLSTGVRINSAKDDAAGLAISQRMYAQLLGMNQAYRNASDAHSMIETADGGLAQAEDNLQRMRELALQAGNGTYTQSDREALQREFDTLKDELARVSRATEFNSQPLLDGSSPDRQFQAGADAGQTLQVSVSGADPTGAQAVAALDITDTAGLEATLGTLDGALSQVSGARAELGAAHNRLESLSSSLTQSHESAAAARSRIADADMASEASERTRALILQHSSLAMLAQAGDNIKALHSLLKL